MSAYRRRPLLLVLAILMFPVPGYAQGEDPTEVFQEELVLADRYERSLTPETVHLWALTLEAGQYVEIAVNQPEIDLMVRVQDGSGQTEMVFDVTEPPEGEQARWIDGSGGRWTVAVMPFPGSGPGSYEIRWTTQRSARDQDRQLVEADSLVQASNGSYEQGQYAETVMMLQQALPRYKAALGPNAADLARVLGNLAVLLGRLERYDEAEASHRQVLSIFEARYGSAHPAVAHALNNLGVLYLGQGRYVEADSLFQQVLTIYAGQSEPDQVRIADTIVNRGEVAQRQGRYDDAERLFQQAIAMQGAAPSPVFLNSLAVAYSNMGRYREAASLMERVRGLFEEMFSPVHPNVALILNNLGYTYESLGRYEEAERAYQRASQLFTEILGPTHSNVATGLSNLGDLYRKQGRYAEAELLFQQALEIDEAAKGPDHPYVSFSLSNLGQLYEDQGRYVEALARYERSLTILEAAFPSENPYVANAHKNLADIRTAQQRYDEAASLYRRVLSIQEATLGVDHSDYAYTLSSLAGVNEAREHYAEADSLYQKALAIRKAALGPEHPDVALSLIDLTRTRSFLHQHPPDSLLTLIGEAIRLLDTKVVYPRARIELYMLRAQMLKRLGDLDSALDALKQALEQAEALRPQIGGGEEARASFSQLYAGAFDRMVQWQLEAGDVLQAFEYAERGRARVLLNQLAAGKIDLRSSIPDGLRPALEQREIDARARLAEYQQRITLLRSRQDLSREERLARIANLDDSLRVADQEYVQVYQDIKNASSLWRDEITSGGEPVSLSMAQQRLVPGRGMMLLYQIGLSESFLFVIPPGNAPVDVLPLHVPEEVADILGYDAGPLTADLLHGVLQDERSEDEVVEGLLTQLSTQRSDVVGEAGAFTSEEISHVLWRLLVPERLRERLLEAQEVVVIPDGALFYLPFEALVVTPASEGHDTQYWLDVGPALRYAPSATSLYSITRRPPSRLLPLSTSPTVLSLSDPIYDPVEGQAARAQPDSIWAAASSTQLRRTRDGYERRGGSLRRLPGTAEETKAIVEAYGGAAVREVVSLQRLEANEQSLRAELPQKRYVHLATHGLVDQQRRTLFASLALTPPTGETVALDHDGFLQLHEIYDLNLSTVEMAVLSACETNVGEAIEGEGVFALSRGFLAAGAHRVLASQWSVDDASTAALMVSFFEQIVAAERAGEVMDYTGALRAAKRTVRSQGPWADPYHWAPFILTGKR